jgi:hypothetical protein
VIAVEAQVPINAFYYYRHILPFPRFGTPLLRARIEPAVDVDIYHDVPQLLPKSLRFMHPLLTFYLYRANFVGAAPDGVGRFEALSAD